MKPVDVVHKWVEYFNNADAEGLGSLYAIEAINHQVVQDPIVGKDAITSMFTKEFQRAKMVCIVEQILESGDWAILEWKDPLGLRGCGFFRISKGLIVFQRGYWDKLSFLKIHGLPIE